MGRTKIARWHLTHFLRHPPFASTEHTGTFPRNVVEGAPESAKTVPTAFESNIGDRKLGITQQRLGTLNSASQEVTVRRYAKCLAERARKMGLRHTADLGKPLDRPCLMRRGVHPVLGAQKATHKERTLPIGGLSFAMKQENEVVGHNLLVSSPNS